MQRALSTEDQYEWEEEEWEEEDGEEENDLIVKKKKKSNHNIPPHDQPYYPNTSYSENTATLPVQDIT